MDTQRSWPLNPRNPPRFALFVVLGLIATGPGLANAASDEFRLTGSLNRGRHLHTATVLSSGEVVAIGGFQAESVARIESFDPSSEIWTQKASLLSPRHGHIAAILPDDTVLVAGGLEIPPLEFLRSAEVYDPKTDAFTSVDDMSIKRYGHTATVLFDGNVLVAGGAVPEQRSAESYDYRTRTFQVTGAMQQSRHLHTATLLPSGLVLIAGGNGNPVVQVGHSAEIYDPATRTFRQVEALMTKYRFSHAAIALDDGRVLLVGGMDTYDFSCTPYYCEHDTTELFDPDTETFSAGPTMQRKHVAPGITRLDDGRILIASGSEGPNPIPDAEIFDPNTDTLSPTGSLVYGRTVFALVTLTTGDALVVGGARDFEGGEPTCELYSP